MQEVNVQVAIRVRPLLPKEKLAGETGCVRVVPSSNQLILGKDRVFTFDYIFSTRATQEQVYNDCVDPLVNSCLEGYNATVFAYGQTGSGKTYTIGGGSVISEGDEEDGIIPRAIRHLYNVIQIYKEELRDLMELDHEKDLHIREDEQGNTMVIGATEIQCHTADDVLTQLRRGSSIRHTGSTQMNERSSRSHSVFTLIIGEAEHYMCAKFHLVDLAGSERAHKTGNTGERFKESVHINAGLLALGNVISALGDSKKKIAHIPYRDSKVTRILKDSLGGNANTVMICCISPSSLSMDESLNALNYANRARNIKNKPIVNRDPRSIRFEEMQDEIKALREELQKQRTSLMSATATGTVRDIGREDGDQVLKHLQEQLIRLQMECKNYRIILDDAHCQLIDVRDRDMLTRSQSVKLCLWIEMMEEIKSYVPATMEQDACENQIIRRLEKEILQYKDVVSNDLKIFTEQCHMLEIARDRETKLEADNKQIADRLAESENMSIHLQNQLLVKQIEVDELTAKLQDLEAISHSVELSMMSGVGVVNNRPRAGSVPAHLVGNRAGRVNQSVMGQSVLGARKIHTSPASLTVDRVLYSFRARSRLILSQIEDTDDVIVKSFSEDDDNDDDNDKEDDSYGVQRTDRIGSNGSNEDVDIVSAVENRSNFRRSDNTRGTYRVSKSQINRPKMSSNIMRSDAQDDSDHKLDDGGQLQTEEEKLFVVSSLGRRNSKDGGRVQVLQIGSKVSTGVNSKGKLKLARSNISQSNQQLSDLQLNIRLKQQLIYNLIRQGKEAEEENNVQSNKIELLEAEMRAAQAELVRLQQMTRDSKQQEKKKNELLQAEYRRKIGATHAKIHQQKKRLQESKAIAGTASIDTEDNKRIKELQLEVTALKVQEAALHQQLIDESNKKACLEAELAREQEARREMERVTNERHVNLITPKLNERTITHKRELGNLIGFDRSSSDRLRFEAHSRLLDHEMEMLVAQRMAVEKLNKELEARDAMIRKKELMLEEKSELEMRKLRSSQMINKDIMRLSMRLNAVDETIEEKFREMSITPRETQSHLREEMEKLQQGRDVINEEYVALSAKLQDGGLLSITEERRLIEMEEAIDAVDAAIDYKTELIARREEELRKSQGIRKSLVVDNSLAVRGRHGKVVDTVAGDGTVVSLLERLQLQSISASDARALLQMFFEKTVNVRNDLRKMEQLRDELKVQADEQARIIRELESSLQLAATEMDHRMSRQRSDYERKIDLLTKQIATADLNSRPATINNVIKEKEHKIAELEKDLYYYKKTSRDLKKKLKDLQLHGASSSPYNGSDAIAEADENEYILTPRQNFSKSTLLEPRSRPSSAKYGDTPRVQTPNDVDTHSSTGNTSTTAPRVPRTFSTALNEPNLKSRDSSNQQQTLSANQHDTDVSQTLTTRANNTVVVTSTTSSRVDSVAKSRSYTVITGSSTRNASPTRVVGSRNSDAEVRKLHQATSCDTAGHETRDMAMSSHAAEPTPPSSRPDKVARREPRLRLSSDTPAQKSHDPTLVDSLDPSS